MAKLAPVLALHQSGHRLLYELSGLRTGSIRDQVLRAQMLVDALLADVTLHPILPLLVIGGGAAGAACALTAVGRGRRTELLERERDPFKTQVDVDTRWIDPVEYDWPQPHWESEAMGRGVKVPALPVRAASAADLANSWKIAFNTARTHPAGLLRILRVDARDWNVVDAGLANGLIAYPSSEPLPKAITHCAAISCVGFSGERTAVTSVSTNGQIQCPPFWQRDDFDLPDLGTGRAGSAASESARLHALVSGGGDGAMQDFVRLATGSMGKRLYSRLPLHGVEQLDEMRAVLLAEDAARRAHTWSDTAFAPQAFARWHQAHEALAEAVWRRWAGLDLGHLCATVLRPEISVTWVVGGAVPGYAYGLNRLLAALVARLVAHRGGRAVEGSALDPARPEPEGRPVVLRERKLAGLESVDGHVCNATCFDKRHVAHLRRRLDAVGADDFVAGPFDLAVARHGVDQRPHFGGAAVTEQTVPFDFPA